MLQLNSININTYNLLKELSKIPELNHFALAGGTALALQMGHRISYDLDFFTRKEFNPNSLLEILRVDYELSDISSDKNSLSLYILYKNKKIKIDFIRHNYFLINEILLKENIRLFSIEDVAAMKLNAISNRGAKKDFYDIYELLNNYSIKELISFYSKKYSGMNVFMIIKSLNYFKDADLEPDPISISKVSWQDVKNKIKATIKENY